MNLMISDSEKQLLQHLFMRFILSAQRISHLPVCSGSGARSGEEKGYILPSIFWLNQAIHQCQKQMLCY